MKFRDESNNNLSWSYEYSKALQRTKELQEKIKQLGGKEYLIINGKVIIIKKGLLYWKALDKDGNLIVKNRSLVDLKEIIKYYV